ncbi:MAG: DEAD/DEAH box helicase [Candidatus Accumulibacter sp.]|jgi:hypothetical protein|uniref:SNF2-related protein n=1 Tax=Accumulibacter sp. TaxID=2053492 RepID=UPI00258F3B4C|nr:SNF2-related protein [Accumulibacter sp.]MBK8114660.1 DEAD/DEAH box helicase [Accumulibacter sp.]
MSPHELVLHHYEFPFDLYPFQIEDVNANAPRTRSGLYNEPGLGKTVEATFCALYKLILGDCEVVLGIMPPLLITQWSRWLKKVKRKNGTSLRISEYEGTPKEREKVSFKADFVLMGIQIFKKDYERVCSEFDGRSVHVFLDEGHSIKDVSSGNYHTYRDFIQNRSHQIVTGTPLNKPEDGYAYINLIAPGVYRNLLHFETCHIVERDIFKRVSRYGNLDLLAENLLLNSVRRTKEQVLIDLPECTVADIEYKLHPQHHKLYTQLANDHLLQLPEGQKIDATQASALYHALGQIVCQWHYFSHDSRKKSQIYYMIEEILEQLGTKKLIVFSNYQRTNEEIVRLFKCPGVWGEIPQQQKLLNIAEFLDNDKCRLIAMNPIAAGQGVDGCQHVCQDVLYTEPPVTPSHLTQSLSRVHREGQRQAVTVRLGVALGTLQRSIVTKLTAKEALIAPIQGSYAYLTKDEMRTILFGGELP